MPPEPHMSADALEQERLQREVLQLRDDQALLIELLAIDQARLRRFMAVAARTLSRVRAQLVRRAREPALFARKIARLRMLYRQLMREAAALPLPTLTQQFAATVEALEATADGPPASGDALLPALVRIDEGFLALTTVAERTGAPLVAQRCAHRRAPRRRARAGSSAPAASAAPQLAVALQQLAGRLADEQGKRVDLAVTGLEHVPEDCAGPFYDMLSQLLRNAVEFGIEVPAQRTAAGKSAQGRLRIEFRQRDAAHSELIFQDDGQGLNARGIVDAAIASGLIAEDTTLAQDPRQASSLIFHPGLSTAADGTGRGLGLRIVRDNVKRLRGEIQVATKRGQFTRFRIKLPIAASAAHDRSAARA